MTLIGIICRDPESTHCATVIQRIDLDKIIEEIGGKGPRNITGLIVNTDKVQIIHSDDPAKVTEVCP